MIPQVRQLDPYDIGSWPEAMRTNVVYWPLEALLWADARIGQLLDHADSSPQVEALLRTTDEIRNELTRRFQ